MSNRSIQNVFIAFQEQLAHTKQPLKNHKAIDAITHCRTRDMGVSVYTCRHGHAPIEQFHSCRHRSCYLCAQKKRLEWIEQQQSRILNTAHFHVIFTLPHEYLPLWRYNEAFFSRLLFKASQQTLLELLADARYGGITPGILMALHTWGRQLTLHPHTHCLVSAGGINAQDEWQALGNFLLPSGVIRRVYRGKVQAFLQAAFTSGELVLPPDWSPEHFWQHYRALYQKHWNVRIEERYHHGKGVVLYLARYCKGGPVHPKQLQSVTNKAVTMRYLDHRDKRVKYQRLAPMDFIKRLLQHVPPSGLHTVRYYGLYASACKAKYQHCRNLLGTVRGLSLGYSAKLTSMLLYCKTCGAPAQLSYQLWRARQKGISINKGRLQHRAGGSVQQDDEPVLANAFNKMALCLSSG